MNGADASRAGDEQDFGRLDAPVHAGALGPHVDRLVADQLVAQPVPRLLADIGHRLNEVHRLLFLEK
jgi:hypothetical protein